jgi:hypothetical protein
VRPSELPWRRPRHELLLLSLVAIATLTIVYPPRAQDISRLCLTQAIEHGHLDNDACLNGAVDVSTYGGHRYSDKAPAMSIVAVPVAKLVGLRTPDRWHLSGDLRVWATRIAVGGLALLLCAFLVGRVAEGLVPGAGGLTLVAFALGTELGSLAVDNFAHAPAAALAFGAFVLAWSRRPFLAGLVAGAGVLTEYETGLVALVLAGYVVLLGWRPLARYIGGVAPAALLLGAYDWAAFGSPFHLSYRYVADAFAADQAAGFFGIHVPHAHTLHLVFLGDRGLVWDMPFLIAAAVGLFLLPRAEALVCAVVVVAFVVLDAGYFDPYGGDSPGPRFLAPALPFLVLGLPPVLARARTLCIVLVGISIVASVAIALSWPTAVNVAPSFRGTVWRRLRDWHPFVTWMQKNVLSWVGIGTRGAAVVVAAAALAAFVVATRAAVSSRRPRAAETPAA